MTPEASVTSLQGTVSLEGRFPTRSFPANTMGGSGCGLVDQFCIYLESSPCLQSGQGKQAVKEAGDQFFSSLKVSTSSVVRPPVRVLP